MYRIRAEPQTPHRIASEDGPDQDQDQDVENQKSSQTLTPQTLDDRLGHPQNCPYRWLDATAALDLVDRGRARTTCRSALWLRSRLEQRFARLGHTIHKNALKVLLVGLFILITLSVGLKSARLETRLDELWVEQGGRLEREVAYVKSALGPGHGVTSEIFIQTPKQSEANPGRSNNVLSHKDFLIHLEALKLATSSQIEMFDITWQLKDICFKPTPPSFSDLHHIDSMIENIFPCSIITPLDCFWEGSRLLGPDYPVTIPRLGFAITWKSFNPAALMQVLEQQAEILHDDASEAPSMVPAHLQAFRSFMMRAGVTTGYQQRPCLDPADPECPATAPNKDSQALVDLGATLTGGCYGFATKFMHWPEEMIVGGIQKNKSGHIVRARAIQSIVQLMGEKDLFEYYSNHYKVHNIDWSPEKARLVLDAWQRKANAAIKRFTEHHRHGKQVNIFPFTESSLETIMRRFSCLDSWKVTAWYLILVGYAGFVLIRWKDRARSQEAVAVFGIIFQILATAGGLGACSMLGLQFSALTTQVLPFLNLGLGNHLLYQLAGALDSHARRPIPTGDKMAAAMRDIAGLVLLSSVATFGCYAAAALLIPIPVLRSFAIQMFVVTACQLASLLSVVPAVASLDLKRRSLTKKQCCIGAAPPQDLPGATTTVEFRKRTGSLDSGIAVYDRPPRPGSRSSLKSDRSGAGSELETIQEHNEALKQNDLNGKSSKRKDQAEQDELIKTSGKCSRPGSESKKSSGIAQLRIRLLDRLIMSLARKSTKALICLLFVASLLLSTAGILRLEDGLNFSDIVPAGTSEHKYLDAQRQWFQFYNIYAVTQSNIEYPSSQRLLEEYHAAFRPIRRILRDDNGALPPFWLPIFRRWLEELQTTFDTEWADGRLTGEGWRDNATESAILAYKLMVQTGDKNKPVARELLTAGRLVSKDGLINQKAFYNYLTAWVNMDPLGYSASEAQLRPEPHRWIHSVDEMDLRIPKAKPLIYAQLPFRLFGLKTTADVVDTISAIRAVCDKFAAERQLPNFPTGLPFTFWEQYTHLRLLTAAGLAAAMLIIFLATGFILLNWKAAAMLAGLVTATAIQQAGVIGWLGVRFSAVPAVVLIMSCGVSLWCYTHLIVAWLGVSSTDRQERAGAALASSVSALRRSLFGSCLSLVVIWSLSPFDFIVINFCYAFSGLVLICAINSFLVLPTLLMLFGPAAELSPLEGEDHISLPPTPPPSPLIPAISGPGTAYTHVNQYSLPHHHPQAHYNPYYAGPPQVHPHHQYVPHYQIPLQYHVPQTDSSATRVSKSVSKKQAKALAARIKSASLSTISEKSTEQHPATPPTHLTASHPPPPPPPHHHHFIEPQLVLETTTYTNSTPVPLAQSSNTTPIPGSVQELNELNQDYRNSPLSRDSPASLQSESSNGTNLSRPASATNPGPGQMTHAVTTKATATLKLPAYLPYYHHPHHPHHPPPGIPPQAAQQAQYHNLQTRDLYSTTRPANGSSTSSTSSSTHSPFNVPRKSS